MSVLDIRTEAIRSRAQEIENIRQSDIEILGKIRTLVLTLDEIWKGQAEEAFVNKYLSQQASIDEFYNTLLEFTTLLRNAANRADSIDNELLGIVNRIPIN